MLASASPQVYADCLNLVLVDKGVDMVLVIAPPPPMFEALEIAKAITPMIKGTSKPVAAAMMGSMQVAKAVAFLRKEQIPEFTFPEDAISAMGALWRYKVYLSKEIQFPDWKPSEVQRQAAEEILQKCEGHSGFVDPEITTDLLKTYGLPVCRLHYASKPEEAVKVADQLEYPVVMKIAVEGISHKSDMGGILLGLEDREAVESGFAELNQTFKGSGTRAEFGVHVQKMIPQGQEVIVGVVRDPIFGPLVMFGGGGTDVEGLKDVAFALAPLTTSDLDDLIESTWAGKKLHGYRQTPPADIEAVWFVLLRLSRLMLDFSEIKEIEINPLILLEKGKGEWVVDARMVL
jgi:acetyltransferase